MLQMWSLDCIEHKWFNLFYIITHIPYLIVLFLQSMKQQEFSLVLEDAFRKVASEHGQHYAEDAARSWAEVGAAYLGFALCSLPSTVLRRVQYATKEQYGTVILNCKWYDSLKEICLEGNNTIEALLPGPDGILCRCSVTEDLFLEMLDFCREG